MSTQTRTFDRAGATITYDVHGDLTSGVPLLILGTPMDASGFTALAAQVGDRPSVTFDPRGTARSARHDDPSGELSPADHVEDLAQLVRELGVDRVDVFASSGGAVNALHWVCRHPHQLRTVVAHEPPTPTVLPDREALLAAVEDIATTYTQEGFGPAMGRFIALVDHDGPLADPTDLPEVDVSAMGLPAQDDGTGSDPLLGQNLRGLNLQELDLETLRTSPVRVVLARGATSGQQMAARSADTLAELTGREVVTLPGDHTGFAPAEWGMGGDPAGFAAALLPLYPAPA